MFFLQNVTLQLLRGSIKSSMSKGESDGKEEDQEESGNLKQTENTVNESGEREEEVPKAFEQDSETPVNLRVEVESDSQASDHHSALSVDPTPEETEATECGVQQEQGLHETTTETRDSWQSAHAPDDPGENLPPENGQKSVSEADVSVNSDMAHESLDSGEHVQEMNGSFGPPANPPPPPNALQSNLAEGTG